MSHALPAVLADSLSPPESATLRKVEFRLARDVVPGARRVALVASFNRWDAHTHELRRMPGGGWVLSVSLPPGIYPYLFDIDGGWHNDPADDGRMPTGWGNEYSLKVVR